MNLEILRAREAEVRARLTDAQDTRKRVALDAELGDAEAKQQLAQATETLRAAELELETLAAAVEQAATRLTNSQQEAERERRRARVERLRELSTERLKTCEKIEEATALLAARVKDYNANTRALVALLGTTSRQLPSAWRLRTFIDHACGFHLAPTPYRKRLVELEQPVLDALLRKKEEI
jgi:molecular chaperone GrpE (heat shock protein)